MTRPRSVRLDARTVILLGLASALLAVFSFVPHGAEAAVTWRGNFETGDLSQWTRTVAPEGGATTVRAPVRSGNFGGRFVTTPGHCTDADKDSDGSCKRYHSQIVKATGEMPGDESWWKWNVLWPSTFRADTSVFNKYGDWHPRSAGLIACQTNVSIGITRKSTGPNYPLFVMVNGGDCTDITTTTLPIGPITPGKWMEFVWHIKWSQRSDGLVELWVNGTKKAAISGPNMFEYLPSGRYDVFFKQGVYTGRTDIGQTVYVDDVVRGQSYDDVAGGTPPVEAEPEPDPPVEAEPEPDPLPEPDPGPTPPAPGDEPALRIATAGDAPRIVKLASVTDATCLACSFAVARRTLAAVIERADDAFDTAYGVRNLGKEGWSGRVWTRTNVSLPPGQELAGNLVLLQVRDAGDSLVYQIVASAGDRILRLVSPEGGLAQEKVLLDTGVALPADGRQARVEVSALANDSVIVKVDGRVTNRVTGLVGATTAGQRFLRAGIMNYGGSDTAGVAAFHRAVGATTAGWLGKRTRSFAFARRPKARLRKRLVVPVEGIPLSRLKVVVRGGHGRRLGRATGQIRRHGYGRVVVRLKRWDGQRRLRVRVRSIYRVPEVRIVKQGAKKVSLRGAERRRLARRP